MMLTEAIHHQTEKMVATFGNEQKQLVLLMQTLILLKILKFVSLVPKVIQEKLGLIRMWVKMEIGGLEILILA